MLTPSLPPRQRDRYLPREDVQDAQARLSRLAGHIHAIGRMLAEGRDCADLLLQLVAVRSALNQVTVKLLEGHIEACLAGCKEPAEASAALERLNPALAAVLGEGA